MKYLSIITLFLISLIAIGADTKISDLTLKASPVANDTTVIVDSIGGANKKITLGTLPVSTPQQTALNGKEDTITTLPISKGGTNTGTAFNSGSLIFSNGTSFTQDNTNLTWNDSSKYLYVNNKIQIGSIDAFSRSQIWNAMTNASMRLGALGQDGDFGDVNSEGIVVYGANSQGTAINSATGNFGYARIKADRIGLLTAINNVQNYYFRADPTEMYLKNDSGTKTFTVTRSTGNIKTALSSGFVKADSSGNLTSSATVSIPFTPSASAYWPQGYVPTTIEGALDTLAYGRNSPLDLKVLEDDFVNRVVASRLTWTSAVNGTGSSIAANTSNASISGLSGLDFSGLIVGQTGTTSTGRAALYLGLNEGIYKFNSGVRDTQLWRVWLSNLSDGTDNYIFTAGFHNATTAKDATTDGIYLQYDIADSTYWRLICAKGGVFDRFTTTSTVTASVFNTIGFEVAPTLDSVTTIINGVRETFSTTKIPNNYDNVMGIMIKSNKTSGTNNRTWAVDYFRQEARRQ